MQEDLRVGDTVGYLVLGVLSPMYYGIVKGFIQTPDSWSSTEVTYVTVEFFATDDNGKYPEHSSLGTFDYLPDVLVKTEPYRHLSVEERVMKKSKKLWNDSKYVKKHPQFAY